MLRNRIYGFITRLYIFMYTVVIMKIFSWNVNGIRAVQKKGLLEPFLSRFEPDILCIQETKAQEDQVSELFAEKYPQYEQYWYSAERKGYAGTAIFTKIDPKQAMYGLPDAIKKKYKLEDDFGNTTKEGRVLTLEFDEYFVSTVYAPNAKDGLVRIPIRQEWDSAYLLYMKQLRKKKPVIYCGDFNVAHTEDDLARPKENKGNKGFTDEERAGMDAMIKAGFIDTFRKKHQGNGFYTWWSHWGGARDKNVGWRIDYVMVSEELDSVVRKANIHMDVMGSDHCPVSIDISV